jgi:phosphoenolpyruvate synthase/pyruvate phosphate dikinase
MTIRQLLKYIAETNWYRQGGYLLPYYVVHPYYQAFQIFDGFTYCKGAINYGYFDKDKEHKVAQLHFKKQLKNKIYFNDKIIKPWRKIARQQSSFIKQNNDKLNSLNDIEFLKLHKEFNSIRAKIWTNHLIIEAFDPCGKSILDKYLDKSNLKISTEDLEILTSPIRLTFMQEEELDRLKLVLGYINKIDITKSLKQHVKKYYWVKNSWGDVRVLDEEYFLQHIRKDAKQNNKKIKQKIKELDNYHLNITNNIKSLHKKYNLTREAKNCFLLFSQMSDWRDERKGYSMDANYMADLFAYELSCRTKVPYKYLMLMASSEVKSMDQVKKLKSELIKRSKASITYLDKGKPVWETGKNAELLRQALDQQLTRSDQMSGTIACRGKIKGRAKIILTRAEFSKFKTGDILITQMTRPEFIPLIKKSAAIITDEGGITCHAAIISRELSIPCIIGAQVATTVLKDGDKIEVDANKGVVTKI